jgi:hypothetical protein
VAARKASSIISRAYWHVQEERDQLQLYGDVSFSRSILLMSIGIRDMMGDTSLLEKGI